MFSYARCDRREDSAVAVGLPFWCGGDQRHISGFFFVLMLHQMYVGPGEGYLTQPQSGGVPCWCVSFFGLDKLPSFCYSRIGGGVLSLFFIPFSDGLLSIRGRKALLIRLPRGLFFFPCWSCVFNMFCFGFDLLLGSALPTGTGG